MKSFEVSSGYIIVRGIDRFERDPAFRLPVKKGTFYVYCDKRKYLYVIHSDWFVLNDQSNKVTETFVAKLQTRPWKKISDVIHIDRGCIGVLEPERIPDDEAGFEAFCQRCYNALENQCTYVTKRGVVAECEQGHHHTFVLQNTNNETIGIKIHLDNSGVLSDDEEVYSSDEE